MNKNNNGVFLRITYFSGSGSPLNEANRLKNVEAGVPRPPFSSKIYSLLSRCQTKTEC